jgi:hypothetical protein
MTRACNVAPARGLSRQHDPPPAEGKRHGEAPIGCGGPPEPAATAPPAPAPGPGGLDLGLWRCAGPGRALRVGRPLAPRRALCALDGCQACGLLEGPAAPGAAWAALAGAAGARAHASPHDACAAADASGATRATTALTLVRRSADRVAAAGMRPIRRPLTGSAQPSTLAPTPCWLGILRDTLSRLTRLVKSRQSISTPSPPPPLASGLSAAQKRRPDSIIHQIRLLAHHEMPGVRNRFQGVVGVKLREKRHPCG